MKMLTISIQQPWAYAIFNCGKDFENRTWPTKIRGRVLIHTGKLIDPAGFDFLNNMEIYPKPSDIMTGGLVGFVDIVDCVEFSMSNWFFGPYGFKLENPEPFPFIPYKGSQRFFNSSIDAELLKPQMSEA